MRGRHVFGQRSRPELAGCCFEWRVIPDALSKLPKFELSQVELTDHGLRAHTRKVTASTPGALWNRMYVDVLGLPAPERGANLCGFNDESLADLLACAQHTSFSVYNLEKVGDRRARDIAAAAGVEFKRAMKLVCPNNPHAAFEALRSSAAWQSEWCDDDDDDAYIIDLPFVRGMVTAYEHAPHESQIAILSLFAPYFSTKQTCALFKVTKHVVTAARLHDANALGGQELRKSTYERMRLSPRTFAFLHQWNRSSFAVTAGDASSNNFKRLEIRQRLYDRYKVMAEQELGVTAVSRDCFNRSMRDGFTDETVDTCCCGGCCDGWSALSMLQDFVSDPQYGFSEWKLLAKSVDVIREFLKGDYRWKHLQESSAEAMHCMQHALGSHSCHQLCESCDHLHVNTCVECNQLPILLHDLLNRTHAWAAGRLRSIHENLPNEWYHWHQQHDSAVHSELLSGMVFDSVDHRNWVEAGRPVEWRLQPAPNVGEQIEEVVVLEQGMLAHLDMLGGEIHRYRAHLVRKHKASQGQMDLLSQVTVTRGLAFIDYKQKVLPAENKEAQSKTFGKRGKSLFGMVDMFHMPEDYVGELPQGVDMDGDYAISYFRACADDADQDYAHSVQCFEVGCRFLKKNYPWLKELMLYSDGAGNFRSLSYELAMVEAVARAGLRVVCHLLHEAGDGKDRVDRDFAGINQLFWSYLKQPNASMQNAVEMAAALEYGRKPGDGVVNCALEIQRSEKKLAGVNTEAFTKLVGKARDNMYYTKFEYKDGEDGAVVLTGARFYAYYEMGEGVLLSAAQLKDLWPDQPQIPPARIVYGSRLDDAGPQLKPKVELSRANKKAKVTSRQEAKLQKANLAAAKAEEVEAAVEARRFSKLCPTCDRRLLTERGWKLHKLVCKSRGGVVTKEMQQVEALKSNQFKTLDGCAVELTTATDFPIPQHQGYDTIFQSLSCSHVSWAPKYQLLDSAEYNLACTVVPMVGWATKESCRRPSVTFASDVVGVLRQCFDAVPRLNNYQIQQELKRKFKLGTKVLRISQISGWMTSEVNRRKKAALAAVADAANMAAEAMAKGSTADLELDAVLEEHAARVLSVNGDEDPTNLNDSAITDSRLALWKYSWRQRRPETPVRPVSPVKRARKQPKKNHGKQTAPVVLPVSKACAKEHCPPPHPPLKEPTLMPGYVQCWHCSSSVKEDDYDHPTQRCEDIAACDLRIEAQVSKKRVRVASKKYS